MNHRERVVRADVSSEHVVQLFDTAETLSNAVGSFLAEGYLSGETLLVVVSSAHWSRIKRQMEDLGCAVEPGISDGRITAMDAAATLDAFTEDGSPDAGKFDATVGDIVRRLSTRADGRGLRIYGEMVDLLVRDGSFGGAHVLEELWCALSERTSLTLFCGYTSAHFGDPRSTSRLERICRLHDRVLSDPDDMLGSWLVSEARTAS